MKIIQISTWEVPCGIAGYTKALVGGIRENQQECDVIPIDRQLLQYMSIPEIKNYFLKLIQDLKPYDVIHIQHEFSFFSGSYGISESIEIFGYFLKKIAKLRKKVFVTFHSEPEFLLSNRSSIRSIIKSIILRQKWNLFVASIFNSKKHVKALVHTKKSRRIFLDCGFNCDQIIIVKQGVTLSKSIKVTTEEKQVAKEKLGFPADSVILSIFGFISSYKGYETALITVKELPKNYYLLIIGSPHPYAKDNTFDKVVSCVNGIRKLKDRIRLTGYLPLELITEYYTIVDVCLAPYMGSTNLSSSAAITWALTSGKPVIASKISAFEELNEDADCLCLVNPDAPSELAYTIQNLVSDIKQQQYLVNNALQYCEENQWKNAAKKHIHIYSS